MLTIDDFLSILLRRSLVLLDRENIGRGFGHRHASSAVFLWYYHSLPLQLREQKISSESLLLQALFKTTLQGLLVSRSGLTVLSTLSGIHSNHRC